jgi:ABC-type nitrate/sulfonate/bicarbonate transport system substrate-binding protein
MDMPNTTLRVLAFDGGFNLPIWAGQEQGLFQRHGLDVQLRYTPNSGFLVTSLMEGSADIALAGFDNIVAYQEGQGEVQLADAPDLFAFMGGDRGFLTLMTAETIHSFAGLRDQTVSVDALTTGFAFALREMLSLHGIGDDEVHYVKAGGTATRFRALMAGEHRATLLRTPYELVSARAGFRALAKADDVLGAYMGTVGAARRQWGRDNADVLVRFLRGYAEAIRWLADRTHRAPAMALLARHMEGLDTELAGQAYDTLMDERAGLLRDLRCDTDGMHTVLRLRSKYGHPQRLLTDPARYVDSTYLEQAMAAASA